MYYAQASFGAAKAAFCRAGAEDAGSRQGKAGDGGCGVCQSREGDRGAGTAR